MLNISKLEHEILISNQNTWLIENEEEPCKYKWINSSVSVFFLYVNEIFLIKNDILYITENKDFAVIVVLHKGLRKDIPLPRDEDL